MPWWQPNADFIKSYRNTWDEVFELCYLPMFGGGFSFSFQEAKKMTPTERKKALDWLKDRRETDIKAFKGKGGMKDTLKSGNIGSIQEPELRTPPTPS